MSENPACGGAAGGGIMRKNTHGGAKMDITVRAYTPADVAQMNEIWNEVVEDGIAFPQERLL